MIGKNEDPGDKKILEDFEFQVQENKKLKFPSDFIVSEKDKYLRNKIQNDIYMVSLLICFPIFVNSVQR